MQWESSPLKLLPTIECLKTQNQKHMHSTWKIYGYGHQVEKLEKGQNNIRVYLYKI